MLTLSEKNTRKKEMMVSDTIKETGKRIKRWGKE